MQQSASKPVIGNKERLVDGSDQQNTNLSHNPSESILTKSNIGAQSAVKLGQTGSRKVLSPTNEFAHEFVKIESRLEALETKVATQEQSIIQRTIERLQTTLPYDQQITELRQTIGLVAQTLQAEILTKVTTLLTDNIDELLPDLPKLKVNMSTSQDKIEEHDNIQGKHLKMINEALAGVDELKGEFEYMKTRFSPQFVQRVDKALNALSTLSYDVEVVKMTTSHAAMKKDLDVVEQKFQNYTPINKFMDLQRECTTFALQTEIIRLEGEIYKTNEYQKKFILKTDINERLQKLEKEIWEELKSLDPEPKT